MLAPLVRLQDVTKSYGDGSRVHALWHVDLAVRAGEWIAVMGPSGSGKTTMLNLIGCLDRPSSGEIDVGGVEITRLNLRQLTEFRRETIGLIFQQFHLIPYLTTVENVMLAQYFHSMPDEEEARRMLASVGLADRLDHLPSQLSGGEQQRVCIARALINQPALLLADEPTGNLDAENEEAVMALFRALHREGRTIVMVTHDDRIGAAADRVVRLEHGRISGEVPPVSDMIPAGGVAEHAATPERTGR